MVSVNTVVIGGNLTRDPELRYSLSGTAVCKFGIAINEVRGSGESKTEKTHYVDCTAFGKTAETIEQYFAKGKPVVLTGRLSFSSWEALGGTKRSKLEVIVDTFSFAGGSRDDAAKTRTEEWSDDDDRDDF